MGISTNNTNTQEVARQVEAQLQASGLRAARKRAGLGLEPCARRAGVTVRLLIAYEMGRQRPGIKNAARLARALGVRVDRIEEFAPAVREVELAGFVLAEANGRERLAGK
jgi:transcriptional regulator with XRE-family HTH domain